MRWVINGFAVIGVLTVAGFGVLLLIAALGHRAEKRRRRDSQDALIAQYISEGSPEALAADHSAFGRYMERQGLRIKTPKGWGR